MPPWQRARGGRIERVTSIERILNRAEWDTIPAGARVSVHPDVAEIARLADARYLCSDLSALTPLAVRALATVHPIIAVPSRREYRLMAGLRTWQIVRTVLPSGSDLRILVIRARIDADAARALALLDVMVHPMLFSLDRTGARQLDEMLRALTPSYARMAPGRPANAERVPGPLSGFFREFRSTVTLAAMLGVAPSTLRRGRR